MRRPGRHRLDVTAALMTRRERAAAWIAKQVCRVIGHDPEQRFTGDTICHRCRVVLGRWKRW